MVGIVPAGVLIRQLLTDFTIKQLSLKSVYSEMPG